MASPRNLLLIGALGLTLAATWYAAGLEEGDPSADAELLATPRTGRVPPGASPDAAADVAAGAAGAAAPTRPPAPTAAVATGPVAQTVAPRVPAATADLFPVRSWQPPPPPPRPVVAEAPPAPTAPPLPFRYLGRMEDGPQITVFLAEGQRDVRVVRQGDQTGQYRIDEITPQGMRLTYLPLQQPQQLLFGSPN